MLQLDYKQKNRSHLTAIYNGSLSTGVGEENIN